MKKEKVVKETTLDLAAVEEVTKQLKRITKQHKKAKVLISQTEHDIALLKSIFKHEKETNSRPQDIYINNIKNRITETIEILNQIYK